MEIRLGNPKPVEVYHADDAAARGVKGKAWNGDYVRRTVKPADGEEQTIVHPPDGQPLAETLSTVAGLWPWHSDHDAPSWVWSDDPRVADALALHFDCDVRAEA